MKLFWGNFCWDLTSESIKETFIVLIYEILEAICFGIWLPDRIHQRNLISLPFRHTHLQDWYQERNLIFNLCSLSCNLHASAGILLLTAIVVYLHLWVSMLIVIFRLLTWVSCSRISDKMSRPVHACTECRIDLFPPKCMPSMCH